MDRVIKILKKIGFPYAYHHFSKSHYVDPPFIVYLVDSNNHLSADGIVYNKSKNIDIEVYTDRKDLSIEEKVEKILDEEKIYYSKKEMWIKEENLYEVVYEITI